MPPILTKLKREALRMPTVETIETILAGLHASYADRRDVLLAFGYGLPLALPTQREIDEMLSLTVNELKDATYPMMLIDLGHRLLAWNRYAPRLIGKHPNASTLEAYYGVTTFDLVFNPALDDRLLIQNPESFWPAWLRGVGFSAGGRSTPPHR
jgi:hypothetical protein